MKNQLWQLLQSFSKNFQKESYWKKNLDNLIFNLFVLFVLKLVLKLKSVQWGRSKAIAQKINYWIKSKNQSMQTRKKQKHTSLYWRVYRFDLTDSKGRYHVTCYAKIFLHGSSSIVGCPLKEDSNNSIEYAIKYLVENESESQISLNEMKQSFVGTIPHLNTI